MGMRRDLRCCCCCCCCSRFCSAQFCQVFANMTLTVKATFFRFPFPSTGFLFALLFDPESTVDFVL
jgi:hypothetical protein